MISLRRINRAVHRDLGFFFFGMCIIYAISGIALNHRHQWNPNYIIKQESHSLELNQQTEDQSEAALNYLDQIGRRGEFRTSLKSGNELRIFIKDGSLTVNTITGQGELEIIRPRPVFRELNFLHYNTPRKLWTWFSDIFAASLILLAFTGLFIIKGKNGISRRGAWLSGAGIIIPLVLLFYYLNG